MQDTAFADDEVTYTSIPEAVISFTPKKIKAFKSSDPLKHGVGTGCLGGVFGKSTLRTIAALDPRWQQNPQLPLLEIDPETGDGYFSYKYAQTYGDMIYHHEFMKDDPRRAEALLYQIPELYDQTKYPSRRREAWRGLLELPAFTIRLNPERDREMYESKEGFPNLPSPDEGYPAIVLTPEEAEARDRRRASSRKTTDKRRKRLRALEKAEVRVDQAA